MNTRRFIAFFAIVAIGLTLGSCKKDGGDKNANCRIVTVTQVVGSSTYVFNITYNNDGKISTIVSSGGTAIDKVFTYSGNTINVNATNSGAFSRRDSITIDNKGRPVNVRQYHNAAGTSWTNFVLEYNGDDLLKVQETTHAVSTPKTSTVTSTNGNTTKIQSPTSTSILEYHTDKAVQRGDYLELVSLLEYGLSIYPHKNLLKTIDNGGGSITNFNYEFNSDGLISKVTSTSGASSSTIEYQYQCN